MSTDHSNKFSGEINQVSNVEKGFFFMFVLLFTDCKILLLKVLHACTSFTKSR